MARLVVKQPNGKFACWSTVVDNFIIKDLTAEQYTEWSAMEAYNAEKRDCEHVFRNLDSHKHYFKDWVECIVFRGYYLGVKFRDSIDRDSYVTSAKIQ